jgi:hypothetical protein
MRPGIPIALATNPWIYIISAGTLFGLGGLVTKWLIDGGIHPLFLTAALTTFTAFMAVTFTVGPPDQPRAPGEPGWRSALATSGAPSSCSTWGFLISPHRSTPS